MTHYDRIARAIAYLERHGSEQPDLDSLATASGMSPSHFHRLFVEWAAITPKQFLQCLTATRLKELLARGKSVLEASLGAGLSGPGRAHDLCVNLEAASPGEIKAGGRGLTLAVGMAESPFGPCLIAESPRGVCHISFPSSEMAGLTELRGQWPHARLKRDQRRASRLADEIFKRGTGRRLRAFVRGTEFQVKIWRALLQIPAGSVTTYARLAKAAGYPGASRAVGSAMRLNPIAFLIPCHRVILGTGAVGNYTGGTARKRAMLAWEAAALLERSSQSST